MDYRVLINKGMNTIVHSFEKYSEALIFRLENGGQLYEKVHIK